MTGVSWALRPRQPLTLADAVTLLKLACAKLGVRDGLRKGRCDDENYYEYHELILKSKNQQNVRLHSFKNEIAILTIEVHTAQLSYLAQLSRHENRDEA